MGAFPNAMHFGIVINEVLADNVQAHSVDGAYPDLIELYNRGTDDVDLGGMSITDNPAVPLRFVFPSGTTIGPGQYLTLIADTEPGDGLRLGFALDNDGEGVYLFANPGAGGGLVDSVAFGMQVPDLSIGRLGPETRWGLAQPTFGGFNQSQATGDPNSLRINEWFANGDVFANDDFVELFNPAPLPVALHGLAITDDPGARPLRHRFAPLSFVAANGFVALTADENPEAGPNHLGFRLSAQVGQIALVQSPPAVLGDLNGDGSVNAADIVLWRKNAGQFVGAGAGGDGDENGLVDQSDYDLWRANFGRSAASPMPPQNTAVPFWAVPSLKLIDIVSYVAQTTDVSQGRVPDGTGPYHFFIEPTPGMPNVAAPAPSAVSATAAGSRPGDEPATNTPNDGFFERIGSAAPQRQLFAPIVRSVWTNDDLLIADLAADSAERNEESAPGVSSKRRIGDEPVVDGAVASLAASLAGNGELPIGGRQQ
jgi:hypothetical protein